MKRIFESNQIFSYNLARKRLYLFITAIIILALLSIIVLYFSVLRNSDFIIIKFLKIGVNHILAQIKTATLLGAFYTSLLGGLFFVIIPMEGAFYLLLKGGYSPIILTGLYVLGLIIAYTANYYIGMNISGLAKKIITPKKFYKIKGIINKYGTLAIFFFNVLPLPSQPLSAILGVFKYNKTRFYVFTILGQVIKYSAISIGYFYIV